MPKPSSTVKQRRELRAQARERQRDVVPRLKERIRQTKLARRDAVKRCAGQCKHRRTRLQRAADQARAELKARIAKLRDKLRAGCGLCRTHAKEREIDSLERLLAELATERDAIRSLRLRASAMTSAHGRAGGQRSAELRAESDDEVKRNLDDDPLLLATWNRLKHKIQGSAKRNRTEAFLEHVQDHPEALEETQRMQEAKYEQEITALYDSLRKAPGGSESELEDYTAELERAEKLLRKAS